MTDIDRNHAQWSSQRALVLLAICLMAGIAGGWFIRGWQGPAVAASAAPTSASTPAAQGASPAEQAPSPDRLKEMADAQAAPLLDKLKSNSDNPDLLTSIGNLYYDAQQYPTAIDYYGRALKAQPSDAAVRTDMATAYWYMHDADRAIAEFNTALTYAPNNANTLFNLGLVKWQGKKDGAGALADWKKLLAANPNYEGRDKVEQMMAEVKKQTAARP